MIKRNELFLVVYAFLIIFSPPVLPKINILLIVSFFTAISIFFNWNEFYKKSFFNKKILVYYTIFTFFILITISINTLFNNGIYLGNSIKILYKILVLLPCQYITSIFLLNCIKLKNKNIDYLFTILIKAGIIQSILSVIAFLNSSIKEFFVETMSKNTGSEVFFQNTIYSSASEFRFFGFSSTLLDTFGYGMGLLCILSVYLISKGKKIYVIVLPILMIPIVLNSRSGLFIFILGAVLYFIFGIKKITVKSIVTSFLSILLLMVSFRPIIYFIGKYSPNTLVWISSGFSNLFSFVLQNEKTNFEVSDVLFSKQFWTLPDTITGFIFGTGHDVYGMRELIGFHSDVGYVNQLWIGGLVLMVIIGLFLLSCFKKSKLNILNYDRENLKLLYVFYILLFIMNIKADLLSYNPGMIINVCVITSYLFFIKEDISE